MVMKSHRLILVGFASLSGLLFAGCTSTDYGNTSPYHPGPVVGKTVGNAAGVAAPFNPNYHMVRHWRTETTSDGRTIQVPYDVLTDQYGRPVNMPAPTGNPPPPPMTPVNTNAPAQ